MNPSTPHDELPRTLLPAASPLSASLPPASATRWQWGSLHGSAAGLAIANAAHAHRAPVLVVTTDNPQASRWEDELRFYLSGARDTAALAFPDWETLPYDVFSPHQDIISQRLSTLSQLSSLSHGIIVVPVSTLMHRLAPRPYLDGTSFALTTGGRLDLPAMRLRLESAGYRCVSQVFEHGEFAVRGNIVDLYPMGSSVPVRVELFDDEIESIRTFNPETQRSLDKLPRFELLPAREFPLDKAGIAHFRAQFRERFAGDPQNSTIYRDVSNGLAPAGIEYYLPLFFDSTTTLFDYLPANTLVVCAHGTNDAADRFWHEANHRYEQRRHDRERPLLPPTDLFLQTNELFAAINRFSRIDMEGPNTVNAARGVNFATVPPPALTISARSPQPLAGLLSFINEFSHGRLLFAAESAGRRETLLELLANHGLRPEPCDNWSSFLSGGAKLAISVAPLEQGLLCAQPPLAVIAESQLFGEQVVQQRRRRGRRARDTDAIIKDLTELSIGAPVVHEEHGVGRYVGLQTLKVGDIATEFLTLEYAGGDKLYVPVSSLHLISRYAGGAPEQAPLHKLGSDQWQKARHRAAEKVRDVAAELLQLYALRAARKGQAFKRPDASYAAFAATFPFEETPDQAEAIKAVLVDMAKDKPMDRLVCGDVGFGKTEVAMRAAFMATHDGYQVAVLVPTTLLAQQHYQSFKDRYADWPVRVEVLSRFRSKKQQDEILAAVADGKVDILIGTHKLLQDDVHFKRLGLVIIDEEHRFGVRQKEKFKELRANVHVLTLSATPIPRTLNFALSQMRDLSIIATPPSRRLAVKTFVTEWNDALIQEACLREIKRGGQVYVVHNDIETIGKLARAIEELVPEATVRIGHGQMSERELEQVMLDFYHQRFNVLVCTTIIETGIDVPTANTMLINRADRYGLAQLYQLRGRVGRSHHRAYAYLIVPPKAGLSADAQKRLDALASIEELGAGFTLAIHDLEIRGAGELLGEGQSGQMQEIGFGLYTEMLERAVDALRHNKTIDLDEPVDRGAEIDLHMPALIPEDYLPDVHSRLVLYKRISSATSVEDLRELQVEMIDRFGLLTEPIKNLFRIAELKLKALPLGIKKIECGYKGGRVLFGRHPNVDPARVLKMIQSKPKVFRLDGGDKIRFTMELPDEARRVQAVHEILDGLNGTVTPAKAPPR